MTTKQKKQPWTTGEKALVWVIVVVLALAGLGALWHQRDNALPPAVNIPTPAMPAQNAYNYFIAAANAEVQRRAMGWAQMGPPPPGAKGVNTWPQLTLAQKAALIQSDAPLFRLVHQGLALPYQEPLSRPPAWPMPDYARLREVARVIGVEEQVQVAQHQWGAAVNSALDDVQLGEKMAHGSGLGGLLTGAACEEIGRWTIWPAIGHLSAPQAKAAARRLAAINADRAPFAATVQEDKWETQAGLLEILRQPDWRNEILTPDNNAAATPFLIRPRTVFISPRQVFNDYTLYADNQIRLAQEPYVPHAASPPPTADVFAQVVAFDLMPQRERFVYTEAQDYLLLVALAMRAYEQEHGAYPARLSALVPKYLSRVPDDPFAPSSPLRYKRTGKSYVLYSVGPDGKDDGGKAVFDASKPAPGPGAVTDERYWVWPDSAGDIVAGVNVRRGF